uniref:Uncharacterized protein n=1 Tax=Meloidogyne enterolobii TaxID=390850 RepID=A0A6V7UZQ5_MELEN|nr:unnamed protein product [Meloidogyne enterolobii]
MHAAKFFQKEFEFLICLELLIFCCGIEIKPLWHCISCHRRKGIRFDRWFDPFKHPIYIPVDLFNSHTLPLIHLIPFNSLQTLIYPPLISIKSLK